MPNSLLRSARDHVENYGFIGPYVVERLTALGYNVAALERRLLDQASQTHDDLRGAV